MAIILDCLSGDRGSIPLRVAKQCVVSLMAKIKRCQRLDKGSIPLPRTNQHFVSLMAERHFYMVTAVVRFHHEVPILSLVRLVWYGTWFGTRNNVGSNPTRETKQ